jgi:hypothetical protein
MSGIQTSSNSHTPPDMALFDCHPKSLVLPWTAPDLNLQLPILSAAGRDEPALDTVGPRGVGGDRSYLANTAFFQIHVTNSPRLKGFALYI